MLKRTTVPALLYAVIACHAQQDDGGRDMGIALFSAAPPQKVVVTAAGPGAWWALCGSCTRRPLTFALHMPAIPEIIAGGPVTVRDEVRGQVRTANGMWHLRVGSTKNIDAVLTLPSERYVAAVLTAEALRGEPIESLRAKAVVARTLALGSLAQKQEGGYVASDTCDSTACQRMTLSPVSGEVSEAVRSTTGETLWFGARRAQNIVNASYGNGRCLQGAAEMARLGRGYRDMLAFHYPNTVVRIRRADNGWQRSSRDGLHIMGAGALTSGLADEAVQEWRWARLRFPPKQAITPTVVFTPTTEVFRQMTSQPGWQLASTSGSTVVLQPGEVLAVNRVSLASTLRHEMLHVVVEESANDKAPLWLREGLVEVLAGDASATVPALSASETERLLRSAGSRLESQAAHQAACARTRRLVERYGFATVRGWVNSGASVPLE